MTSRRTDTQTIEQLGLQYVDQRRTFAKLITTVKQTSLRHHFGTPTPKAR